MIKWNLKSASYLIMFSIFSCSSYAGNHIQTANENAKIELITLGVAGGPLPRKESTQVSDLLVINNKPYLIDAGDNVTRRIVQADYDFKKISPIFITHPHSDHTLGLATLLISQWEYQRRELVDIYGPSGLNQISKGIFEFAKANEEIRWAEGKKSSLKDLAKFHEVGEGSIYKDQNVTVYAVENNHFHFSPNTPPYGKYKSYSYKFVTPTKSIFFTGDTGPSANMEKLMKGSDVLVSEVISIPDTIDAFKKSGIWQKKTTSEQEGMIKHFQEEHLTPEQIGIMATKAGVKTIILTHFTPTVNDHDNFERYADRVKKDFKGDVLISKDLQKFKF
ncbi:MBL fold metallo-hydrolase [Acinetobacter sp. ANC 4633]|uniref:MBL fold metallo-hydrolase n=1 Tax=Acinetobacter sp. ANC 4633 TaxID=2529845 RepID=UPI00103A9AA7|nr:MBL fold metallo-hydrolase [Acinetobacter sp. ANC 4633]TCB28897.1 MBL fold metallo-hydrolase [Acinetobacter sp. ANC 4633]